MIINSIKLKNFKSYEDETEFSFTPSQNKNIVLIGGENGSGKSTLFEAIRLCIYGPSSYGYLGNNPIYLNKVKNNINNNAFKNEIVDCNISVTLSFFEGTQIIKYILNRNWVYVNQKIIENFQVFKNDKLLTEDEASFFNKYLQANLPHSLFNFFFFDGEELSEFFNNKNSSHSFKEAVLQLFNYDTFSVLKKHLLSFQRKITKENRSLTNIETQYDQSLETLTSVQNNIKKIEVKLASKKNSLHTLLIQKDLLEKDFKTSGGILENEEKSINSKIISLENERTSINQYIKDYCNDILPFLLITDLLKETIKQIEKENIISSYNSIKNKLSGDIIRKSLLSHNICDIDESKYNELATTIINQMFNIKELSTSKEILMLSSEQQNNVLAIINAICSGENDLKNKLLNSYNRIKEISERIKALRDKLSSSVTGDFVNSYLVKINSINDKIHSTENEILSLNYELNSYVEKEKTALYNYSRVKNTYTSFMQNDNNLNLSSNITEYIDTLLSELTQNKLKLLEKNFIEIFNTIIRKSDYVSSIVIDSNFECTLYVLKNYSTQDILNIINNLGVKDITKKYGLKFVEDLLLKYRAKSFDDLLVLINSTPSYNCINLRTKVNVNDLSKGEKQIYILCLIWSLIKSSEKEIPFILDTPYARVDETHRKSLTNNYLPNISNQVILLSTNEEIDKSIYKIIKPYICHEYLLLYNEKERKTEIKKGYFEV
ncbi:AAA family ATPase [Maledivibacter halophilus]|uniref:DNA sulfur modification protein DndD n=1 Tax=Maledivibacter halophilus TaxID=36842 RepID=A0A1T5LNS8_9FIRM|nr:AAA family ATPase [Maledivibacter halophilus]SKC77525.1 DNA sulfur modification protein DndD [Maledivibacter halophilus]